MLRLFASIRKTLINEGKTSRYVRYAVGEVLLIMVGILLALQVQTWNENRKDRLEEKEILSRLAEEIDLSIRPIPFWLSRISEKKEALARISKVFQEQAIEDNGAFLADVQLASIWSWGMPRNDGIAYLELTNSGKLGLVRNTALRTNIIKFFKYFEGFEGLAQQRQGRYGRIVFDLVPRDFNRDLQDWFQSSDSMIINEWPMVIEKILNSDLESQITPELSRSTYLEAGWTNLEKQGRDVLAEIEAYLAN